MDDFERLNILLAVRDRELARALDRNTKRIDRFERQTQKSLSKASANFNMVTKAATKMGAAIAAYASINALSGVVADLDNIGKTADRLGLTTTALQELRIAAESSGIGTRTLDMAMQRFGRRIAEARQGTGEALGALREMGVALKDASGDARSIESVLADVADRMAAMENQTDRNRIAMKLFDSEGVAMVNMLRDGSDGLAKLRDEARATGAVIEDGLVRQAEETQTRLDLLSRSINADLARTLMHLAPLLETVVAALAGIVGVSAEVIGFFAELAKPDFRDANSGLAMAIDNVTLAMADEIRQSQVLRAEIAQSQVMSQKAARTKLEEARAHRETAQARLEEIRSITMQSAAYQGVTAQIAKANEDIGRLEEQLAATTDASRQGHLRSLISVYQERLAAFKNFQNGMTGHMDEALQAGQAEVQALEATIQALEDALAKSTGEVVDLGDRLVAPVELGERLKDTFDNTSLAHLEAEAKRLAESTEMSLENARKLVAMGNQGVPAREPNGPISSGRGGDPRKQGGAIEDWQKKEAIVFLENYTQTRVSSGARISKAQRETNRLMDEGVRLEKQMRTSSEELAAEKERLKELLDAGAISAETYQRALMDADNRLGRFSEMSGQLKDALLDVANGGEKAFDRLGAAIKRAAFEYLLFGSGSFSKVFGGGFKGVFGGLPGFYNAGFTGSGNPKDPAGIVHKGEYVFGHKAVRRMGVQTLSAIERGGIPSNAVPSSNGARVLNVTFAPTVDARGADQSAVRKMFQELERLKAEVPAIVVQKVQAMDQDGFL